MRSLFLHFGFSLPTYPSLYYSLSPSPPSPHSKNHFMCILGWLFASFRTFVCQLFFHFLASFLIIRMSSSIVCSRYSEPVIFQFWNLSGISRMWDILYSKASHILHISSVVRTLNSIIPRRACKSRWDGRGSESNSLQKIVPTYLIPQRGAPLQKLINSRSAGQEFSRLLWIPKVLFCVHKSSPLDHILSKFSFNIILVSTFRSSRRSFP
jgi:hypothetical protein